MIREKAKELLNLLNQGKGCPTLFNNNYYDEEVKKIIEIATNECKSKVLLSNGTTKQYESSISIDNIRDIIYQLLSEKNTIKNSLVRELTSIPKKGIEGILTPVKIDKKVSQEGIPYIDVEKPLPDNFLSIINKNEKTKEQFIKEILTPYLNSVCKQDPKLSKKHFLSRIFSFKNRKEITSQQLQQRCNNFLRENTDLDEEKMRNASTYFVYNLLENPYIKEMVISNELNETNIQVIGQQKKSGYDGMLQNMSYNLLDILQIVPSANDGLKELKDIYANLVGTLQSLSIEPSRDPKLLEEQIKGINKNINRHRQEYYAENGYRTRDVGFDGKDVGLLRTEYVPKAMELYSQEMANLLETSYQMTEQEYIKEVAKLHFRFIQIHPFPDGNGRTARAISNMLLLEKNNVAIFPKQNRPEYISDMNGLHYYANEQYMRGLYTDQSICSGIEEEKVYKLEEYIGIKCIDKEDLYKDRYITEELTYSQEEQR